MQLGKILILALLFVAGTFSLSYPQSRKGQVALGGNFSALRLVGGTQKSSTISGKTGLHVDYFVSDLVAVGYNWNYGTVRPKKSNAYFAADPDLPFKTFLSYHLLEATFYPLMKSKKWQPFIAASTGLLQWDVRNISNGGSVFKNGFFYGKSLNKGTLFNALIGTKIGVAHNIKDTIVLKLFLNLTHIFDQRNDNIGTNDVNTRILDVGLGLSYNLFVTRDSDGDGIDDKHDAAPLEAEDFDGFQDADGAPDYDNDGDGIIDQLDKAPLIPEDIDGFEDDDGVPDLDNDWDGIPDSLDGAPNQPEDLDGYQDDDGIPDLDDDGDGIPDISDACKGQAETYNGYRDDDGCPDEVPKPLVKKGERIVLQGVNFELSSARLEPESYIILDQVYESLFANPEIEVEIRGYTDNTGSESFNRKLSQARADTVRTYLVKKGIDSYRITAKGYGSSDPIADNNTEVGRAKNRRIEFFRKK